MAEIRMRSDVQSLKSDVIFNLHLVVTNFHCGEKAKAMRLQPITIYTILYLFYVYLKVQGDDGTPLTTPSLIPCTTIHHAQQHLGQGD